MFVTQVTYTQINQHASSKTPHFQSNTIISNVVEGVDLNQAAFKVSFLLLVAAAKVSGVCDSSRQKQVAVKAAGGGGLLEEVGSGGFSLQQKHSDAGGGHAGMKKLLQLQR